MSNERYGVITLLERDLDRPNAYSFKIISVHLFDRELMRAAHELPTDGPTEYQVDYTGDPVAALTWLCSECRGLLQRQTSASADPAAQDG